MSDIEIFPLVPPQEGRGLRSPRDAPGWYEISHSLYDFIRSESHAAGVEEDPADLRSAHRRPSCVQIGFQVSACASG